MLSYPTYKDEKTGDTYTIEISPDADLGFATVCNEMNISLGWYPSRFKAKIGSMLKLMRIIQDDKSK